MEIKILFDSKRRSRKFLIGWGVPYLIENRILFDTGEDSGCLFNNMDHMGVKINDIETIVISHDHFDHTGGLWDVLQAKPGLDVYICPGFSREFKNKAKSYGCNLIEVDSFTRIADNIHTTGQIEATYGLDYIAEQSLVLDTDKGLTIVTGCAHPGIINIVERVKENAKKDIHLVMGGFHLLDESVEKIIKINNKFNELGVQYVGPAHCTGEDAIKIFKESYRENLIDIQVGRTIEV
ncbi:MAG: MBL fold metallo-hydrolase [Proteobacteria bacterium]|nr:MBL fold metallo-hydrolase [Pseudomonadota bacterium]